MGSAGMQFTGERYVPELGGEIRLEHLHRYAWATPLCHGKSVLDIACGEGYGSFMLAQEARHVVGVDIDAAAVAHATERYSRQQNLRFAWGSACAIPLASGSVERVVSFETIEHLREQDVMLAEIRRVLAPEGLLVLSSPNRPVYGQMREAANEFHVRELDFDELDRLLRRSFPAIRYVTQRMVTGSALLLDGQHAPQYSAFADRGDSWAPRTALLGGAVYFVAVCAAQDSLLPELQPSFALSEVDDPVKRHVTTVGWAKALDVELMQTREKLAKAISDQDEAATWARSLERELSQARATIEATQAECRAAAAMLEETRKNLEETRRGLEAAQRDAAVKADERVRVERSLLQTQQRLAEREAELHRIIWSRSWRLTRPLRVAGRLLRGEWRLVMGGLRPEVQRIALKVYLKLPLSHRRKQQMARLAYRVGGPLFSGLVGYEQWKLAQQYRQQAPLAEMIEEAGEVDRVLAELAFPVAERPRVTIIIPTYGKLAVTLTCLRSIARNMPSVAVEIIVVEDASGDAEIGRLAGVPGLRYEVNAKNLGFLRSCNRAVQLASGEFVHFLNNDTEVTAGWLDALVGTFERWPDCGLAGSKLVFPDGRLQEAGGIVWADASAWNFGRLQDPERSMFNFARETDYCSAASILVRTSLLRDLGGFDELYVPAYCEDTDLAFRIRERGLKVVYQPRSVVIHFEGVSHGTDETTGIKAYQVENQKKFLRRWQETLKVFHFPNAEHVFLARERSRNKRCVLVVDHYVPQPDRDAGSRTMYQWIELLVEMGYQVKFWPENLWRDPQYAGALQAMGVEVFYGTEYSNAFDTWIAEHGQYIDYALLSRPYVAANFIDALRANSNAKIFYYGHDIHHLRIREQAKVVGISKVADAEAARMEELERRLWSLADVIYYPADGESSYVRGLRPDKVVRTIPVFGFRDFAPVEETNLASRRDLLFVAGFGHPPNEDAAVWFTENAWPLIRAEDPSVRLWLVGSNPTENVKALAADENVLVSGYVTDEQLAGHYARARVVVAPLRYGAGMKGKVVEAMRFGVPVVTTSIGAQGMEQLSGTIPVHDDAERFAAAVLRLLSDDDAWRAQRRRQTEFAQENFSLAAMRRCLMQDMLPAVRTAATTRIETGAEVATL
jgi:GT2 family glycosyltransferase/glycosyltransferase involved in cell wall biosynthesis/SAM-dependent methyltransferase